MLRTGIILLLSFGYIAVLFAIAHYGDRRADLRQSIISNPYIYALSLAVYCTAWTFYGSVGRAVQDGIGFLSIYIGPTLMATLGWGVVRKIIRISKVHHITSIADFIASRYGKSTTLGGTVTVAAVLMIIPYIALQLKAISSSFLILIEYPDIVMPRHLAGLPPVYDTAFYVAMILAVFAIFFGTRHLAATERHEGLVAAIAFESIVKLVAFLLVGMFVTYGIFNGFSDIIEQARASADLRRLFVMEAAPSNYFDWFTHVFLSMMAVIFLPRQFQVAVVENVNHEHLNRAMWLFPLYLLAINLFVLPVALGGMLLFPDGSVDADTFLLTLPMFHKQEVLAVLVFIGGLSAATGMVVVETVALSTMICNDLVMPVLLRVPFFRLSERSDLSSLLLSIRRASIVIVLLLGYAYFYFVGEFYTLVSIGMISFAGVAQFAPSILCGIFWKGGTRSGAWGGILAGFSVWTYTLVLPSMAQAGLLSSDLITRGPFGLAMLRPFSLFGLQGFNHISHAVFWSMVFNVGAYVGISLFSRQSAIEHTQAVLFVDVARYSEKTENTFYRRGTVSVLDLRSLLCRFIGTRHTERFFSRYGKKYNIDWNRYRTADAGVVSHAEKLLASVIGSASARVMVNSVIKEEPIGIGEVMDILDETRQVITYSRELERVTADLKDANDRLKELDRLKDEFISTVTHELRTPLTSVRSIAEILHDHPDIDPAQQKRFASVIINESCRLTRLIGQLLDFQKIESGRVQWEMKDTDLREVITDAVASTSQLIRDKKIELGVNCPDRVPPVPCDRDQMVQVMVNLISNAVKFCEPETGCIDITLHVRRRVLQVDVRDNGIGIRKEDQECIFETFRQIRDSSRGRPPGSGLGLSITRKILAHHHGRLWVSSRPGQGAVFSFTLPRTSENTR